MFFTSFFYSPLTLKYFKNIFCSLPACSCIASARPMKKDVRTTLSISCVTGSLTLETALIFPFFLLTLMSVISFISILGLQTSLQMRLEETARKISSLSYISSDVSDAAASASLLTIAGIRQLYYSEDIENLCEHSYLQNGYNDIHFEHTNLDTENAAIDLIITYTVVIPFIPDNLVQFDFIQNTSLKLFNGIETFYTDTDEKETVYITPKGTVYHTQKYCPYLRKYTDIILESALDTYEQKTGKHYYPCSYCSKYYKPENDSTIYISRTGNSYHYTCECYHLNSTVYEFNINDIPDSYTPCQRCSAE